MTHYTVMVQVKEVRSPRATTTATKVPSTRRTPRDYIEDDEEPTTRRVADIVSMTVQASDEGTAIRKAIALLNVELENLDKEDPGSI
jgi:hypothetical protein